MENLEQQQTLVKLKNLLSICNDIFTIFLNKNHIKTINEFENFIKEKIGFMF